MFDSSGAIAALMSRNHIADWAALMERNQTAKQLQEVGTRNFLANANLAQAAASDLGQLAYLDKQQKYYLGKEQRDRRAANRQLGLQALIGAASGFAGDRLGLNLGAMPSFDANSLLRAANDRYSQISTLLDPNPDLAGPIGQMAAMARGIQ